MAFGLDVHLCDTINGPKYLTDFSSHQKGEKNLQMQS